MFVVGMFRLELLVWNLCLEFMFEIGVWNCCLEFLFEFCVWNLCLDFLDWNFWFGVFVWNFRLEFLCGIFVGAEGSASTASRCPGLQVECIKIIEINKE